jgi:hypothetical protein
MPEPKSDQVPALSLDDVRAHFANVREAFLSQLDELDRERTALLAAHPDREQIEGAAQEQRREIEATFARIGALLVATGSGGAGGKGGKGGGEELIALVAEIRRATDGLEAMLLGGDEPEPEPTPPRAR